MLTRVRRIALALTLLGSLPGCHDQQVMPRIASSHHALCGPPTLTFSVRLASKMFINTIPAANCASSAFRMYGPPLTPAIVAQHAAFATFCKATSLGENPPSDAAVVPLDARVLSIGTATWQCQAGNAAPFNGSFVGGGSVGGPEGPLVGIANAPGIRDNINANGTFALVSSGRPNPLAEPAFQALAFRARADIWNRTTAAITCGTDDNGQPTSSINWALAGRTLFPSHKIFRRTPANAPAPVLLFNVAQGLFSNLWSLPAIPAP